MATATFYTTQIRLKRNISQVRRIYLTYYSAWSVEKSYFGDDAIFFRRERA